MTPNDAVAALDAIDASNPKRAHAEADKALLLVVPAEVFAAYMRVIDRCPWWASA